MTVSKPESLSNWDAGREQGQGRRTEIAGESGTDLRPIFADLQVAGASSSRQIAAGLNQRGTPTA